MVALMWIILSVVLRGVHFGSCCFLLWTLSFTNVCLFVFSAPSLQSVWIDWFLSRLYDVFCCKKIVLENSSVFVCFGELIEGFLISWCYFNSGKMDQFMSSEEKHSLLLCWAFSQSEVKHSHSWAHYIGIIYQGPEKTFPTKAFR